MIIGLIKINNIIIIIKIVILVMVNHYQSIQKRPVALQQAMLATQA